MSVDGGNGGGGGLEVICFHNRLFSSPPSVSLYMDAEVDLCVRVASWVVG